MSIVCEEVFDETSHPSIEEIRDYATKIGIDPDDEPQLLPLAAEGLMKALPACWKPCFDAKSNSYYYYNRSTGKTQWEHPLDDIYRGLVKKARTDSQSISINEPTDDATFIRDDMPSFEESIHKKSDHLPVKKRDKSPLLRKSPTIDLNGSPKRSNYSFVKQKSEDNIFGKHPRSVASSELKISGGGSMFLKSNTKKNIENVFAEIKKEHFESKELEKTQERKSIIRDHFLLDLNKEINFTELEKDLSSENDEDLNEDIHKQDNKQSKEEEVKKVQFSFDLKPLDPITPKNEKNNQEGLKEKLNIVTGIPPLPPGAKSKFTLPSKEINEEKPATKLKNLKLIKPNPSDFIKPILAREKSTDSEDDVPKIKPIKSLTIEEIGLESDDSDSPTEKMKRQTLEIQKKLDQKVERLRNDLWKSKNEELEDFKEKLEDSQQQELDRIILEEKQKQEIKLTEQLKEISKNMEQRNKKLLEDEEKRFVKELADLKAELQMKYKQEELETKINFETKKEELEKYYEDKLVEIERNLAETMEKNRDEIMLNHNDMIESLKHNNSVIIQQLKKEFQIEENSLREEHNQNISCYKDKLPNSLITEKSALQAEYEKLQTDKKFLEDKYKCLKGKYIRLKNDVKSSIEKRNKKKDYSAATTTGTTGSESDKNLSVNIERPRALSPLKSLEKPPTPKHSKTHDVKVIKQVSHDQDTSLSDRSLHSEDKTNKDAKDIDCDTSENSVSQTRSHKKSFSRKNNPLARNSSSKKKTQRACSPVENLRRQLQKLDDLEDEFPQNQPNETYHLRYPFTEAKNFEGSTELEFFRHRIHLERDSIKRAKESLRTQKTLFQQRQKDLKLKHGSMARHTYQQLCQEEKELTDMEVSLHRTRSLLGEKVIRLRHLEQTLQRVTVAKDQKEDMTLSDISSHSGSSGFSSTEFAMNDIHISKRLKNDGLQESSEIIQSLENLNSEIQEIWDVLRKQQQQSGNITAVIPPFVYPDLGWPLLASATSQNFPAPASIPTLADRLNNYRQHVALANAQSTVVTHANQGATTTLVERTRNLRHWLKQTNADNAAEGTTTQATL